MRMNVTTTMKNVQLTQSVLCTASYEIKSVSYRTKSASYGTKSASHGTKSGGRTNGKPVRNT